MIRSFHGSKRSLLLALLCAITFATPATAIQPGCPARGSDEQKVTIPPYAIRTIRGETEACLEVKRSGVVVYRNNGELAYTIGNKVEDSENVPFIKPGTNITGGAEPQLIVNSWSGGAHCCYSFMVLQLGKEFRVVANLDAQDSEYAHFEDVDHDGKYEFVTNDWTFAYWHACTGRDPSSQD
jgi:hypothetical protein